MTLEEANSKLYLENRDDYIANPEIVKSLSYKSVLANNLRVKDVCISFLCLQSTITN